MWQCAVVSHSVWLLATPWDCSPPGSSVPAPGKNTGVGCQFLLQQCGRPSFNSWVGMIPWRRTWQHTPVLLLGESHGQRNLWATVHGITKSCTWLRTPAFLSPSVRSWVLSLEWKFLKWKIPACLPPFPPAPLLISFYIFGCARSSLQWTGFSSCGTQALLPQGHRILVSRPGIKSSSPVLEDRFFTSGPPGKSLVPSVIN